MFTRLQTLDIIFILSYNPIYRLDENTSVMKHRLYYNLGFRK